MKINLKGTFTVFKNAFKEWNSKDPFRESAVIAYYAIFSLPGLLVLIISLAGYFFGREAVSGHIYSQVRSVMGGETALQVQDMIAKASEMKDTVWATIIGVLTIIIGATGVFAQFQKSLNVIWEVKADPEKEGIWSIIKVRLFSFGLIVSIAFILLISLVITSALSAVGEWVRLRMPEFMLFLFQTINFLVTLAVISLLFAMMFKFLPDAKIKWRDVWIGSVVTALLFNIGKSLLGFYFGKANPGEGYGPAGSIILILLWVSYTSMIVFYGAEYTRAYADRFEKQIRPSDHATKDPDPKREDKKS
jgi:membrane protein